ncbi:LEA domain protein [Penicillium hetheringtonii]|uniref:LEA domain protein n=1 Tax=Penicillium hetheringtonii TaxID=911720 RepID=A0AAD6DIR3_9EURO|nr:LEA domain protein [Penicillium hetheringtonii]
MQEHAPGIYLAQPLSRKGVGPGMIIVSSSPDIGKLRLENGVPSPLLKWAEEGYAVVAVCPGALQGDQDGIASAIEALSICESCQPKGKVGIVAYDPKAWSDVIKAANACQDIVGVAVYGNVDSYIPSPLFPMLQHLAGASSTAKIVTESEKPLAYGYAAVNTHQFATPFHLKFDYGTEAVSHTRNLSFLKPLIGGPYFDLEAIWEEHTYHEFETRSVPHTMATMVQEPYVNHIPTLTGGIGRARLTSFYQNHFIFNNPADTELELISRTVGIDRVVDEFIYKFTHDMQIDWLFPGIPPTGRKAEIPFTAVVNVRGDRLYHEHIAWDQMTALVQVGLMPEYLPWTHPVPSDMQVDAQAKLVYRVPGAGRETAEKMRDKNAVESNQMFKHGLRTMDTFQPPVSTKLD